MDAEFFDTMMLIALALAAWSQISTRHTTLLDERAERLVNELKPKMAYASYHTELSTVRAKFTEARLQPLVFFLPLLGSLVAELDFSVDAHRLRSYCDCDE